MSRVQQSRKSTQHKSEQLRVLRHTQHQDMISGVTNIKYCFVLPPIVMAYHFDLAQFKV